MKLTIVAGARPNFMKIAPLIEAIEIKRESGIDIEYRLVHTGQHYDKNLSDTFFEQLGIPYPDVNLEVKSGTQAEQAAGIMIKFEEELQKHPTDVVVVVGDVTSTMACAIVTKKAHTKLAHVEAGIRSGDMRMPEEVNRIVTDSLTDYFFTTTQWASDNLLKSGVDERCVFKVGNVMIDTLRKHEHRFIKPAVWDDIGLIPNNYLIMTMHRPSNVDEKAQLRQLIEAISSYGEDIPIVFPVHPRTKKLLDDMDIEADNLYYSNPMGYLEFNYLVKHSKGVVTDSGGITEEATVMNVPCITLRENTERPETCTIGTNELVGNDLEKLKNCFETLKKGQWKQGGIPELWDGKAAERIISKLIEIHGL